MTNQSIKSIIDRHTAVTVDIEGEIDIIIIIVIIIIIIAIAQSCFSLHFGAEAEKKIIKTKTNKKKKKKDNNPIRLVGRGCWGCAIELESHPKHYTTIINHRKIRKKKRSPTKNTKKKYGKT